MFWHTVVQTYTWLSKLWVTGSRQTMEARWKRNSKHVEHHMLIHHSVKRPDALYVQTGDACGKRGVFLLTCIPEVVTWVFRRKRILLSCWGPGVMLPSCRFRGGQRHTLPETCSACAHTGSQSTATSTTTRYNKQNMHTARTLMYPVVDTSPGAEGQKFPVRVCLYLGFTTVCCELISLMCHTVQSYKELLHQFLLNAVCVCVLLLNRFQLQGFPFCFRFPVQNVQGFQVPAPV